MPTRMTFHRRLPTRVLGFAVASLVSMLVAIACARTTLRPATHDAAGARNAAAPVYDIDAVRYATVVGFPVAALVAGADTTRRMDIAMMVWLARDAASGRVVLMDAGFYRDKFVGRWKPAGFQRPSDAVARAGVRPEDVTDIIVSHVHWDHLDGADLFPRARIWIQRDEYEHYVDSLGHARSGTIDSADADMIAGL